MASDDLTAAGTSGQEASGLVAQLSRRLRVLEDERAVIRVLTDYGRALDYGLEDLFLACFTPGATWIARRRSGHEHVVSGHAALLELARGHTRAPTAYHKHVVSNIDVRVSGRRARAFSYFVRLDVDERPGRSPYVFALGRYLDELVRGDDDRWRIRSRLAEVEDRFRD